MQNRKYTFKYNESMGRHGWLRLTPAYSVKLVEEIISDLGYSPICVLEPFSGTGTTELVCANMGINSIALEINPFLVWLANTKLKIYSNENVDRFLLSANYIVENIDVFPVAELPQIYNISRWWGIERLHFLAQLKSAIYSIHDSSFIDLLKIAFCRMVIELSNASFNHISTSFSNSENSFSFDECKKLFLAFCDVVASGACRQPIAKSHIELCDSKKIPHRFFNCYDVVITSPPYPNRMSYIRELRPYMYWLDYLKNATEASDLDWRAIGGTWGKATSLLLSWNAKYTLPPYVYEVANKVSLVENKSSTAMGNYILKYFEDINEHLSSVYSGIRDGGEVFYIIGNSSFYGTLINSEEIYADIMERIGFKNVKYKVIRKRNCNKKLFEFVVSGKK